MELNYAALNERLSQLDRRLKLVNYIFRVQGAELRRLDYGAAAKALGVDWKTVSRYCDQLADERIIAFEGDKLKLNPEIIEAS